MQISDSQFLSEVLRERNLAKNYADQFNVKRQKISDYYFQRPFGNEVKGQSECITSDLADVIESATASLFKLFTQTGNICTVQNNDSTLDKQSYLQQQYLNYLWSNQNGNILLQTVIKDALMSYTGVLKVQHLEERKVTFEKYKGLSDADLIKLQLTDDELNYISVETVQEETTTHNIELNRISNNGRISITAVPPHEFLISPSARDFITPRFIGERTQKTRSELIQMGFDKDTVNSLLITRSVSSFNSPSNNNQENKYSGSSKSNESVEVLECYIQIDSDEDGISELWQLYTGGDKLLHKERVNVHPYAVLTSILVPHQTIGYCLGEQVADIQLRNSVLTRQMLNNIYNTNYQRLSYNDRVDLDDLLVVKSGGTIHIEGNESIGDAISTVGSSTPIINEILQAKEAAMVEREMRTGVTRVSQGLDATALNRTATGYVGMSNRADIRLELVARNMADGGLKVFFEKLLQCIRSFQNKSTQIKVLGEVLDIDPAGWEEGTYVSIQVGSSPSEKMDKLNNLQMVLQQQEKLIGSGSSLTDNTKYFNTLQKIINEVGLHNVKEYFNDPNVPQEQLVTENNSLKQQNNDLQGQLLQLQQQLQNPLVQVEQTKAQGNMLLQQSRLQGDLAKQEQKAQLDQQKVVLEAQLKR